MITIHDSVLLLSVRAITVLLSRPDLRCYLLLVAHHHHTARHLNTLLNPYPSLLDSTLPVLFSRTNYSTALERFDRSRATSHRSALLTLIGATCCSLARWHIGKHANLSSPCHFRTDLAVREGSRRGCSPWSSLTSTAPISMARHRLCGLGWKIMPHCL